MKKDLIVTSISSNYSWNDLKNWIHSLYKTTYKGDVLCVCYNYNGNEEILQKIKSYGIEIIIPNNTYTGDQCDQFIFNSGHINKSNSHIAVHNVRFFHTWQYLVESQLEYNRVINTDIRDIVFQYNPSEWLDKNFHGELLAPCEEITYTESWNYSNAVKSFGPYVHEYYLKSNFVCNAGTFAAKYETFKIVCLVNYLISCNTGINADQVGMNILFNSLKNVQLARMTDGWALQVGGVIQNVLNHTQIEDNKFYVKDKKEQFCIIHQYDRIPEFKKMIDNTYEK
jgi:hypothetical protein